MGGRGRKKREGGGTNLLVGTSKGEESAGEGIEGKKRRRGRKSEAMRQA